jgi:hypothetical protein
MGMGKNDYSENKSVKALILVQTLRSHGLGFDSLHLLTEKECTCPSPDLQVMIGVLSLKKPKG